MAVADPTAEVEVEIVVEQTRSERYGKLERGQILTVPAATAAHWERHKIAVPVGSTPPTPASASGPPPEETEFPCKHPDCVERLPFKSAPAHRGHVTRQHGGKETPPPPAADAAKGDGSPTT